MEPVFDLRTGNNADTTATQPAHTDSGAALEHFCLDSSRTGITIALLTHGAGTTALPGFRLTSSRLSFFSLYAGRMTVCFTASSGSNTTTFTPGSYCLSCSSGLYTVTLTSELPCKIVWISLSHDTLKALLGNDPALHDFLYIKPDEGACIHWESTEPDMQIRIAASQLLSCSMTGKNRKLYIDSKCMEILSIYINAVHNHKHCFDGVSHDDIQKLHAARNILIERIADPPGIAELSRICSINEFKLKRGFKKIFRQTIFDVVRKARMTRAKILIEDNDFTVSRAAYEVGYSSVSKFIAAFK